MYISIYSDVQALIYCTIDTSSFSLFSDMGLRSFSSLFSMGKINALRSRMDLLRQIVYAQKDDFVIENHENRNVLLMPQKIAITFETILNILKKAYLKSRFNYLSLSIATWKLAFMAFVKEDLLNSACGRWFCFYWPEVVKKTKSRNHDWNFSYKPSYLYRKLDINCMTGFWMSRGILQLETKVTFFCSFGKHSYNYNNRAYQNMATPPFPEIMQNLLILGLFQ